MPQSSKCNTASNRMCILVVRSSKLKAQPSVKGVAGPIDLVTSSLPFTSSIRSHEVAIRFERNTVTTTLSKGLKNTFKQCHWNEDLPMFPSIYLTGNQLIFQYICVKRDLTITPL
ncbi:uncharacterized protein RAG0_02418 [Rhynchosporium agropyri]|uniref:Uncharacterized protein n=1 Tax=Rhynchosporium agropyri TaxID=914238 RepID=A0A1E1K1X5_9HELO|nr:uncharacterized protein RAG0_02418 [Rhynchosporium agropyri]